MKIYFCVKEFGKIRSARINISNFTVFIGENNSGKTKLMELIYGVLSWLSKCSHYYIEINFVDNKFSVREDEIRKLIARVNQVLKQEKQKIVQEIFNRNFPVEEICFEIEDIEYWYEIINVNESNFAEVYEKGLIPEDEMRYALRLDNTLNFFLGIKYSCGDQRILEKWRMGKFDLSGLPKGFVSQIVMGEVLTDLLGLERGHGDEMLFLPASRMGLMYLYKDYFGIKYEDKEQIIGKNRNVNISQPMRDFLFFCYCIHIMNCKRKKIQS